MCGLTIFSPFRDPTSSHLSSNEKNMSTSQTTSTNRTYSMTRTYSTNRTTETDDYPLPPPQPHEFESTPTAQSQKNAVQRMPSAMRRSNTGRKKGILASAPSFSSDPSAQKGHAMTSPMPIHSYSFVAASNDTLSERESRWIAGATDYVREYMESFDASHDFAHVQRVLKHAFHLLHVESTNNPSTRYDPTIVALAALMHDVGDKKYRDKHTIARPKRLAFADEEPSSSSSEDIISSRHQQNRSRQAHDPQLAALLAIPHDDPDTLVKRILLRLGAPQELARTVQRVVKNVSYSHETLDPAHVRGVMLRHPELAIVQDADRLDAIGAIGIGRCFTYGGASSATPGKPARSLQDSLNHFNEKLVRIESMMKTREGKRLARVRTERLRVFQSWWQEEMGVDQALVQGLFL